ncbi:dihydropteroate synthase [Candidatus Aerophobetes bacterium]|uniref:Dihydropteroate synthase n=1 Tax=Aerophobetes bacterium TaxID=2030807 RepID=A0A7V5M0U9_UNCAE|nr:dihydropteroate synthase [Candidatus Aerophobetes bacterium]HHF99134.1 dihydropteroate synthase [Candidatus Aerophobetes bacterium]
MSEGFFLNFSSKKIDLEKKVAVMGILNLTPDSFYDGGRYRTEKEILKRVEQMIEEGADIIDIGGESTRPGSDRVSVEEELRRTIPYLRKIRDLFDIPLSIDTYKAKVAKEAIEAGAEMVNDISGLRFDPEMAEVISSKNASVVLMHIKGTPKNMQDNPFYESLMDEIISYLRKSLEIALKAGIDFDRIVIDPGIGFGKTVEHNLFILKNLEELRILRRPILIGVSRKSFIGKVLNLPVEERLFGSLAATSVAVMNGARIVRCHDVRETRQVIDLVDAILKSKV